MIAVSFLDVSLQLRMRMHILRPQETTLNPRLGPYILVIGGSWRDGDNEKARTMGNGKDLIRELAQW